MQEQRKKRGAILLAGLLAVSLLRGAPAARPAQGSLSVELPILMYHHLLRESARHGKYVISPDDFAADLDWLLSQGYETVTVAQLIGWVNGTGSLPEKPVMITFDDAYESFYEYAFPILQQRNCKAVLGVVGRYADDYTASEDHHINYSYCTWTQLDEMVQSGLVELQNHSYDLHTYEGEKKGSMKVSGEAVGDYEQRLRGDVGRMQSLCEYWCGVTPTAFVYPFGSVSAEALPVLKDMGFQAALTCLEQVNYLTGDAGQLFSLGRFNRPDGTSAQQILQSQ